MHEYLWAEARHCSSSGWNHAGVESSSASDILSLVLFFLSARRGGYCGYRMLDVGLDWVVGVSVRCDRPGSAEDSELSWVR